MRKSRTGIACVGSSWIPVIEESDEKICNGCDEPLVPYGNLAFADDNNSVVTLDCRDSQSKVHELQWACEFGRYVGCR